MLQSASGLAFRPALIQKTGAQRRDLLEIWASNVVTKARSFLLRVTISLTCEKHNQTITAELCSGGEGADSARKHQIVRTSR